MRDVINGRSLEKKINLVSVVVEDMKEKCNLKLVESFSCFQIKSFFILDLFSAIFLFRILNFGNDK